MEETPTKCGFNKVIFVLCLISVTQIGNGSEGVIDKSLIETLDE